MFSINTRLTAILVLTLMLASVGVAQTPQPAPAAKEPDYVQEKGFKSRVFEIKNRNPHELANVLRPLGSGFKGSSLSSNEEFKTITVRDFPENLATIEEALKRLDVPEAAPPRSDIEFHIHILIASNTPAANDDFPAELSDVVKQMQATLKYKNYGTMASAVHRATANGTSVSNNGVAESKLFNVFTPGGSPIFFNYNLPPIRMNADAAGGPTVSIGQFRFHLRIPLNVGGQTQPQIQYQDVGFETPVTVRNGERVVVGTTTMGDKGLIVVLSAKFNNK